MTTLSPTHKTRARPFAMRSFVNITCEIASLSQFLTYLKKSEIFVTYSYVKTIYLMVYTNYAKTTLSPTHEARARPFQKRGNINTTAEIASVTHILISLKDSASVIHNFSQYKGFIMCRLHSHG